jgi:hypothetical protein
MRWPAIRSFAPWGAEFHSRSLLLPGWSVVRGESGDGGGFKNHEQPLSQRWNPCFGCGRRPGPMLSLPGGCPKQAANRTGLGETVTKPSSATGTLRLKSPAKRPRIVVWTGSDMDKRPRPPSLPISHNPVSYSAAPPFHFLTLHPTPCSSDCFPLQPPSSQSGDLVGRGWQRLGLASGHKQSGPEVSHPSAENPLLGPQSTSQLRLSPVPRVAAGDGMQVPVRLGLFSLLFFVSSFGRLGWRGLERTSRHNPACTYSYT